MKQVFAAIIGMTCALAQTAQAGAWLRESRTGFASYTFGALSSEGTTHALYVEYGLTGATTVGVDITAFANAGDLQTGSALAFLRRRLGPADKPTKLAYELGVGGLWHDDHLLPAAKATVSWGRGLQLGDRSGWINVDASYTLEPQTMNNIAKIDATAGLNLNETYSGLVELTFSRNADTSFSAIEPSVLIRPKNRAFRVKLGAQLPFDSDQSQALKLGIWREF